MSNIQSGPPGPFEAVPGTVPSEAPPVAAGSNEAPAEATGTEEHASGPIPHAELPESFMETIEHKIQAKITPDKRRLTSRKKPTLNRLSHTWEIQNRQPYHDYVHTLVLAGWDNLQQLDEYMERDLQDMNLVVSVVDITQNYKIDLVENLGNYHELETFMKQDTRGKGKVRFYLVEHSGLLQSSIIDCLGTHLDMDPRFFAMNLFGPYMVMTPSDRHRALFTGIGFTVLRPGNTRVTKTNFFRVSIYMIPDSDGSGYVCVILFNSHTRKNLSTRTFTPPPSFTNHPSLLSSASEQKDNLTLQKDISRSLRELYISSLSHVSSLQQLTKSHFYAIGPLLKLNYHCWNEVITTIRNEDRRLADISEASFGHVEEIQRTLATIESLGTKSWSNDPESQLVIDTQTELTEDFKHLISQSDRLWEDRRNIGSLRDRQRQARWATLTNSFTFVFIPISLISSIYGMNVQEISGDKANPKIWQFFVACVGLNVFITLMMAFSHWMKELRRFRRVAGPKEIWGFAMGNEFQTGRGVAVESL